MKAQFDLSLRPSNTLNPRSQKKFPYFAIAANVDNGEQSIVIVNPYGVIFIGAEGHCSYAETEWFNDAYRLVEKPKEISLTLRNEE